MQLTKEEERMLDGEEGETVQRMMRLLVTMGEAFDARRMVPLNSVHLTSVALPTLRLGGKKLINDLAASGLWLKAFTTVNPSSIDSTQWQEMGTPEDQALEQLNVEEAIHKIGAVLSYTCTPYLIGNLPRFGQPVAWGEAHAVIFINSVLGARTNPEGGPSALAAAITGRIPSYGLHLDEHRMAKVRVRVEVDLKEVADYGVLGYWTGEHCQGLVPFFMGMTSQAGCDELKMLSAGLTCLSSPALFHAVGVTPEARSEEEVTRGQKPIASLEFGEKELKETRERLWKATSRNVEWVALGCPHCSINEIKEVANFLKGKEANLSVDLWVCTSRMVKTLSDRMGFTEVIEKAGGKIVKDTCPVLTSREALTNLGFKSVATNSAQLAHYMNTVHGFQTQFGGLKECLVL